MEWFPPCLEMTLQPTDRHLSIHSGCMERGQFRSATVSASCSTAAYWTLMENCCPPADNTSRKGKQKEAEARVVHLVFQKTLDMSDFLLQIEAIVTLVLSLT